MSGGNVTIGQFNTTTTPMAAGDSIAAYQATASQTVRFLASQVAAYVYSTTVALTNQTLATSAGASAGYVVISVNGTPLKVQVFSP